jgi:hypothetical protein
LKPHAAGVVHFEDEPGRRLAAKLQTKDEARRIALNIGKLPELLRKERAASDGRAPCLKPTFNPSHKIPL